MSRLVNVTDLKIRLSLEPSHWVPIGPLRMPLNPDVWWSHSPRYLEWSWHRNYLVDPLVHHPQHAQIYRLLHAPAFEAARAPRGPMRKNKSLSSGLRLKRTRTGTPFGFAIEVKTPPSTQSIIHLVALDRKWINDTCHEDSIQVWFFWWFLRRIYQVGTHW